MSDRDLELAVDLRNPGQFFACCGILEAASRLDPGARGWFGGSSFRLSAPAAGGEALFRRLVTGLAAGGEVEIGPAPDAAKFDEPVAPLEVKAPFRLRLDFWLDVQGQSTRLKTWAGAMKVAVIVSDLRLSWARLLPRLGATAPPFDLTIPMTGRFGFDPRASWNALDVGFSPKVQKIAVETSPLVELLAALGLQRFRAAGAEGALGYVAFREPSAVAIAAARAAGALPGAGLSYRFEIESRGKYKGFSHAVAWRERR